MKYQGSKARISKDLAPIINKIIKEKSIDVYCEPFVGGANMIQHIECQHKWGFDNNEYLIALLRAISKGWNPLDEVIMTKALYQLCKSHPERYKPELVGLTGFCASYNSKWFGGYAGSVKTKIGTIRNYYDEAVRNLLKQADSIKDVLFISVDYRDLEMERALIYCDPPYQNTTGYKDTFNHSEYWEWVRIMSKKNIVLCSEYTAPEDFVCIWEKQLTTTLDKSSRSKAVERFFIHNSLFETVKEVLQ